MVFLLLFGICSCCCCSYGVLLLLWSACAAAGAAVVSVVAAAVSQLFLVHLLLALDLILVPSFVVADAGGACASAGVVVAACADLVGALCC